MTQTNYGEMDLVIDDSTGRATRVRGGVVGTREAKQGRNSRITSISAEEIPARLARLVGSNPAPSPYKSKLETAWAHHLNMLRAIPRRDGGIQDWRYEPLNFRLPGKKNFYRIDFAAWDEHGIVFYEIKGRNLSDDRSLVKMKTAAGLNPWARFVLVKRIKGVWEEKCIQ